MREILFRGQTRRKGEKVRMDGTPVESNWVYGGVLQGTGDHSIIYQTEPDIEKKVVYTDTLGQFTGMADANGAKIFEGDIIKTVSNNDYAVVKYNDDETEFYADFSDIAVYCGLGATFYSCDIEIIGNIHDNPELLGGEY
jgi:uncharacterized phage protein (TIGR01671 family)